LRVLLVSHGFPPFGVAGVERATEASAAALVERGHEVAVLTRRPSVAPYAPRLRNERHGGLDVFRIWGGGSATGSYPGFQGRLELLFERVLVDWRPDVVMITHLMFHSPLYVDIAHAWGIPVAVELHDFYAACERAHLERASGELCQGPEAGVACATHCFAEQEAAELRWTLRTRAFRSAICSADLLLCPSRFVGDYFEREFGVHDPAVLGNGVDPMEPYIRSPRRRQPGTLRLATIGVFHHKGPHVVVKAARLAGLEAVDYLLLGPISTPYDARLRKDADSVPGLAARMYGPFAQAELSNLLLGVDAVVVASQVPESYSRVARESFACGIPVVASRLGALPEAVRHGENGMLFDHESPAQLAAILQALADDPHLLEKLRQGIRRSDWISSAERGDRLDALLRDLSSAPVDRLAARVELTSLSAMRSAALESERPHSIAAGA